MNGLICSVVLAANAASMAPMSDHWTSNYASALQAARLQQRPLLVILENPNNPDQRVEELKPGDGTEMGNLLLKYELCRVDVTTDYGQKVAEVYDATALPCTVITDKSCRIVMFRGFGQYTPEMWSSTLEFYSRDSDSVAVRHQTLRPSASMSSTGVPRKLFSHANLASAQTAARESNRPLLVFVTMPGCHFCDKMKAETWKNNDVESMLTSDFETVLVDQTEAPDWVYDQGIRLFPATLIFSPQGEAKSRIEGFVSPSELRTRIQNLGRQFLSRR